MVSNIKDQRAAISTSVESVAQRLELLLPRSVPYLQIHLLVVYHDFLLLEIGTDCGLRVASRLLRHVLLEERSFADP
jgi:hypothetical protein